MDENHAFAEGPLFSDKIARRKLWFLRSDREKLARRAWLRFLRCSEVGTGVMLGPKAWCINATSHPSRISLSRNVVCRGLLRIESFGDGFISIGQDSYVGDDCLISSAAGIKIGDRVLLGHGVQVFDNDSHPIDASKRTQDYHAIKNGRKREAIASQPVCIGSEAWIGCNVIILKGARIGERTIIGAGSVVTKSIPPDSIAVGNPISLVKPLPND